MTDSTQHTLDAFEDESSDSVEEGLVEMLAAVDTILKDGHEDLTRLERATGNTPVCTAEEWDDLGFTSRVVRFESRLEQATDALTVGNQNLRSEYGIE